MPQTRRRFLQCTMAGATCLALPGPAARMLKASMKTPSARTGLKILILGGTRFIGPNLVEDALQHGHEVTLFNRGRTNPHLFPELEKLVGDRDGNLKALHNRRWDAVIDTSGYVPRHVHDSATLLRDAVDRYLFTSTRQVYADFLQPDKREDAPKDTIDDPTSEDTGRHYGPLKVLCEERVVDAFHDRASIVRPTAVAGPDDHTGRFTYWPIRIDRGGEVLTPGGGTDPIQYIDVRDLARFMIHILEQDSSGAYNAAGPEADMSVAEFVHGIRGITTTPVRFTWIPADFLARHKVRERSDMPLWTAPSIPGSRTSPINREKAVAAGLTFRPLADTAKDTLNWYTGLPRDERPRSRGISADRECSVLAAWHAHLRGQVTTTGK